MENFWVRNYLNFVLSHSPESRLCWVIIDLSCVILLVLLRWRKADKWYGCLIGTNSVSWFDIIESCRQPGVDFHHMYWNESWISILCWFACWLRLLFADFVFNLLIFLIWWANFLKTMFWFLLFPQFFIFVAEIFFKLIMIVLRVVANPGTTRCCSIPEKTGFLKLFSIIFSVSKQPSIATK